MFGAFRFPNQKFELLDLRMIVFLSRLPMILVTRVLSNH